MALMRQTTDKHDFSKVFGRMHPVFLHFPIACLILAMVFEWIAIARRGPAYGPSVRGLLIAGVLSGVLAILSGLQFSEELEILPELQAVYDRHETFGFIAIGAALLAVIIGEIQRRSPSRAKKVAYRVALHAAAITVGIGAQAGGALHWGVDFLPW
jgi:uncharacterized membrane protein